VFERHKQMKADLALLFVAFIWGVTFVVVQDALTSIGPYYFLAIRFFIAFAFLAVVYRRRLLNGLNKHSLFTGIFVGMFLFGGYAFQTVGLKYTGAANSGFITGLSVVLVPIISAILTKKAPTPAASIGVLCATAGLAFLSLGNNFQVNPGDVLTFFCAICFGMYIILVGRMAARYDAGLMATLQIGTVSLASFLFAVFFETLPAHFTRPVWTAFIITAIPATSLAFLVQNTVQKFTSPTHTAIIFTMEPVFAAISAYLLASQVLTPKQWLGCALILAGMLISELKAKSTISAKTGRRIKTGIPPTKIFNHNNKA